MKKYLLPFLFSIPLFALPRFSVENGSSCNLCHVNPTGAGLRNDYGVTLFSMEELPIEKGKIFTDEDYTGMILDHLRFGADIRFQVLSRKSTDNESKTAYFPMQGDLYGNLSVSKGIDFYVKHDIIHQQPEFWTTLKILPFDGYIRFGKFIPTYGLRLDDHSAFIRGGNLRLSHGLQKEGMIFSPYNESPGILETGLYFSDIFFTVSTSNKYASGNEQGYGFSESLNEKNFTFRGEHISSFGLVSTLSGLSYMKEGDFQMKGIFGGVSFKRLNWIGEMDLAENWVKNKSISLASFSQFSYVVKQGVHILARYDLFDEDINVKHNAVSRVTLGADIFPFSFFEIKLQGRFTSVSGGDSNPEPEYIIQFHTWF